MTGKGWWEEDVGYGVPWKKGRAAMAVDGEDFSEEVSGVNEAGKENKTEELLRGPLFKSVETHVDGLGLPRPNRRSRKPNRTLVVDKQ